MDYTELLQQVQVAGALDRGTAERVLVATVVTLAERMSHQELGRLGARLPAEVQGAMRAGSPNGWGWSPRRSGRRCGRCWAPWSGRWPRWRRSGCGCRASSTRSWPDPASAARRLSSVRPTRPGLSRPDRVQLDGWPSAVGRFHHGTSHWAQGRSGPDRSARSAGPGPEAQHRPRRRTPARFGPAPRDAAQPRYRSPPR
jgi:hypothetical protein